MENKSPLQQRIFKRFALTNIIITLIVTMIAAFSVQRGLRSEFLSLSRDHIKNSLNLLTHSIKKDATFNATSWCLSLPESWEGQYTLIDQSGRVICDNLINPNDVINQLDQKEIIETQNEGFGYDQRISNGIDRVYGATTFVVSGQRYYLRHSLEFDRLEEIFGSISKRLYLGLLPLLICISLLILWASFQISTPLKLVNEKLNAFSKITKVKRDMIDIPSNSEWDMIDKALDYLKNDLESAISNIERGNKQLNTIIRSITDGILAIDKDNNILFANHHFIKLFSTNETFEKVKDMKTWDFVRNVEIKDCFLEVMEKENKKKLKGLSILLPDGKNKSYFDLKVYPLKDEKKELYGAVGIFNDVSDTKLLEQMREDFVANVSHEVKTPLTAIKGYAQVVKVIPPEKKDEIKSYLEKIEKNTDRLNNLFSDILNLSVIESNDFVKKENVSPEDMTMTVVSNVRQSHLDKNINVETHYDIDEVWVNPMLFEQVLTNLIDNAFKYSPKDTTVSISWYEREDSILLTISDQGIGIPAEARPRIFERFYRVDPSRSREMGGTGLGLAIVKHIVQKHEAKINVDENESGGTTFNISLPKKKFKKVISPHFSANSLSETKS